MVIDAGAHGVDLRAAVRSPRPARAGERAISPIIVVVRVVVELRIEIFDLGRPIGQEGPFDAAAGRPAAAHVVVVVAPPADRDSPRHSRSRRCRRSGAAKSAAPGRGGRARCRTKARLSALRSSRLHQLLLLPPPCRCSCPGYPSRGRRRRAARADSSSRSGRRRRRRRCCCLCCSSPRPNVVGLRLRRPSRRRCSGRHRVRSRKRPAAGGRRRGPCARADRPRWPRRRAAPSPEPERKSCFHRWLLQFSTK